MPELIASETMPEPQAKSLPTPNPPRWHTAALVFLIVAVATTGAVLSHRELRVPWSTPASRILWTYFPLLLVNAGLLFYVTRVGVPRGYGMRLVGVLPRSGVYVVLDLALGVGVAILICAAELGWHTAFASSREPSVSAILPSSALDRAVWSVVAVGVGCAEEV